MVHPHSGILFSHKKECSTDSCYSIDEPWENCYNYSKKSDTKEHILHHCFYEMSKTEKPTETDSRCSGCQEVEVGRRKMTAHGPCRGRGRFLFGLMKIL